MLFYVFSLPLYFILTQCSAVKHLGTNMVTPLFFACTHGHVWSAKCQSAAPSKVDRWAVLYFIRLEEEN